MIQLPNIDEIRIELPEHKDYTKLHHMLNINKKNRETYDDVIIKIHNNEYFLDYIRHDFYNHTSFCSILNIKITKGTLFKILIYVLYYVEDFRYYAKPSNYNIETRMSYVEGHRKQVNSLRLHLLPEHQNKW